MAFTVYPKSTSFSTIFTWVPNWLLNEQRTCSPPCHVLEPLLLSWYCFQRFFFLSEIVKWNSICKREASYSALQEEVPEAVINTHSPPLLPHSPFFHCQPGRPQKALRASPPIRFAPETPPSTAVLHEPYGFLIHNQWLSRCLYLGCLILANK